MNVLQSSKVFCFIKNIYLFLYNATISSIAASFFVTVVNWFCESIAYRVIVKIMQGVFICFKGSFIYKLISRSDKERTYMDSSLILGLFNKIVSGITGGLSFVYNKLKRVNDGSLNNRTFMFFRNTFSLSFENILGLFMIAIVIVPEYI